MLRLDVVLIEPYADIGGIDFDQFGKRIERSSTDGHCPTNGSIELRQFFTSHLACRVNTCPRFIDHQILDVGVCQLIGEDLRDELFGFAARRSVSNRNDGNLMFLDLLNQSLA